MSADQPLSRRLRVLVLTSTFPRWVGDTEPRFVLDLCRYLAKDAEVLVLAPHAPGAARAEELEGVRVQRFRYFVPRWQAVAYEGGITQRLRSNRWRLLQLPFFFASLLWATWRSIRTWSPDVIHAHWIVPQAFVACIAAGRAVPILCTSHGGDLHALRGPFFRYVKAWTLTRCNAVTVVSESMVPHVLTLAPSADVAVIPMGTDLTDLFVPPPASAQREANRLLFVGRLVAKKGVDYLLEAFAVIARSRPDLRLTIAGRGPLETALREKAKALGIADRVTFLGGVPHAELPALYQKAAVAVFPFVVAADGDQEGFGLVTVEAMGCGCPVIASDLPAVRDAVEPGVTGVLVPAGDVAALAEAIRALLEDSGLREMIARQALARAQERFDWAVITARYLDRLQCLATMPPSAPATNRTAHL